MKKALGILAAVAGAGAVAYGGIKLIRFLMAGYIEQLDFADEELYDDEDFDEFVDPDIEKELSDDAIV